jgi:hypothetical protein
MSLGFGGNLTSQGLTTPTIVTDNLVMKHMYPSGSVQKLSDGAVYCDGSTYVDCGTGIGTALGDNYAGDLTVSMWFKANATTGVGLFQSGNESHNNREFSLRLNSNKLEFGLNNIGWQKTVAFTDTSNWHHVTAVLDNGSESTSLLYLDGVSVGSVEGGSSFPTASNLDFNGDDTHIGRFYNSEFNGYICNVGMWTRILTPAEIKSIMFKQYAGLTTSEKNSLVSFWNLDVETNTSGESGTGGVKDHHGSNHGTLT